MARERSITKKPLESADIREKIELSRRLVALGSEQIRKALVDLDMARIGLQELEADLAVRGVNLEGGAQ